MQISRSEINNVVRFYLERAGQARASEDRDTATHHAKGKDGLPVDNLTLSPRAQEIQRLRNIVMQIPDVREDRVRLVKESLDQGKYQIDGAMIAGQFLARMLGDRLAGNT